MAAPRPILSRSTRIAMAAGIATVLVVALIGVVAFRSSGLRMKPVALRPSSSTVAAPIGKLISWDVHDKRAPKSYLIDGLALTLTPGPDREDTGETVILSVTDRDGHSFKVEGDTGNGTAPPVIGVGRLDMSNASSQIIFSTFTGGAHCCFEVKVLELLGGKWNLFDIYNGNKELDHFPTDVNGDGIPDFVLLDEHFASAFDSFADSWMPPKVLFLSQGRVVDASSSGTYAALFASDMEKAMERCANHDATQNGACAGYVADAARIGQFRTAWRFMLAHYDQRPSPILPNGCRVALVQDDCPTGSEKPFDTYPEALAWFLATYGYISSGEAHFAANPNAICDGAVQGYFKLLSSSPFAVEGHCYFVPFVSVFQWIDDKTALTNFGTAALFLTDFPRSPTSQAIMRTSIVFGEGVYRYEAANGSMQTVPRVLLLSAQVPEPQSLQPSSKTIGSLDP